MKEVATIEDDINDQLFAAENDAAGTVGVPIFGVTAHSEALMLIHQPSLDG
jgi:hypothetical protein